MHFLVITVTAIYSLMVVTMSFVTNKSLVFKRASWLLTRPVGNSKGSFVFVSCGDMRLLLACVGDVYRMRRFASFRS